MLIRVQNFRERWLLIISKQMLIRLTEMVMELSDTYLQSVTSDIMILSHVHVVFVRHLEELSRGNMGCGYSR